MQILGARHNQSKDTEHPNYKHGNRTKESMATYSRKVPELDHLEAIAHSVGIMEGRKRSGRKPKIKPLSVYRYAYSFVVMFAYMNN